MTVESELKFRCYTPQACKSFVSQYRICGDADQSRVFVNPKEISSSETVGKYFKSFKMSDFVELSLEGLLWKSCTDGAMSNNTR